MEGSRPQRAAIVTGASSGIGLALARMLAEEGHALTINGRRADKLEAAAAALRDDGHDVLAVPGSVASEDVVREIVARHGERHGRLDVLCNNAGIGIGEDVEALTAKALDMQLEVNLRPVPLFYREAFELLCAAGAEHGNALVLNTASISGKRGEAWLSVYSATKHGIVGFSEAMNRELLRHGIKSTALCPAFVDTPMTGFLDDQMTKEQMITVEDVIAMTRPLLSLSPGCLVPEIMFDQTSYATLGVALGR